MASKGGGLGARVNVLKHEESIDMHLKENVKCVRRQHFYLEVHGCASIQMYGGDSRVKIGRLGGAIGGTRGCGGRYES